MAQSEGEEQTIDHNIVRRLWIRWKFRSLMIKEALFDWSLCGRTCMEKKKDRSMSVMMQHLSADGNKRKMEKKETFNKFLLEVDLWKTKRLHENISNVSEQSKQPKPSRKSELKTLY